MAALADNGPIVTTNTRYARGATMAFARMMAQKGDAYLSGEQGICYATHPNPTVADNTTSKALNTSGGDVTGTIYWLQNLEPSTCYYMRGYAKDRNGNVGYGDVVRFYTLPKGNVSYYINGDMPDDVKNRLTSAADRAVNYWNSLTSIQGFRSSLNYSPGTPTADCSYGGWVRYGTDTQYQSIHTTMHEWTHGVGVGTHWIWYNNADMRANTSRGQWLGDRATELIRFLHNDNTSVLSGDNQHMWPYQMNYASEDHGETSYICNGLMVQALGEDGLPLTESMGFASPYDAFDCEDSVKYYLRSEDKDHGLYSSLLTEQADGSLQWTGMKSEQAVTNDSAAWYFKYNPVNCMYTVRNAATGHYIVYNGGFRAQATDSAANVAQLQLLRGRVASVDGISAHGYFLAYNSHVWNSPVLAADADGKTTVGEFSFSNSATSSRWLILTADESAEVEKLGLANVGTSLEELLKNVEALRDTPHREDTEGADAALSAEIEAIRSEAASTTDVAAIEALETRAYAAVTAFLPKVTAADEQNPFDLTFMLTNPAVMKTEGWEASNDAMPTMNYSCGEYFEKTFDFHQTIHYDLPKGYYRLKVQAFQRPGTTVETYTAWSAKPATSPVTTEIYVALGSSKSTPGEKVKNIWDDAQTTKVGKGNESTQSGLNVPNDMQAAAAYFDNGLYDNTVDKRQYTRISANTGLKVGIRCTSSESSYWSIFRNFRLYFIGSEKLSTGIAAPATVQKSAATFNVYSLSGQCVRRGATSLSGLPAGIYIVNGKKVMVR